MTAGDRGRNALLEQLGLEDKFVIQYAGNMGYVHDVETIIEAAALLADTPDVHFLFIGSGAKQAFLEAADRGAVACATSRASASSRAASRPLF